jgi:hypothetical protein
MRYLILFSLALFAAATFSSITAPHASAISHAAKAVTVSSGGDTDPQSQYSRGRRDGYRDAKDSCQEDDVSDRSSSYQSGYTAGFNSGYNKFCES